MADLLYDYGLDEWRTWTTGTYTWLSLRTSYTPDRIHHFIADLVADEVTASGYARDPVAGATRTVDTSLHRITYDCSDPDFGALAAGQDVGYVVLAKVVTDDADSVVLALFDIAEFATDGGQFSPVVSAAGAHYIDQT